MIAGCSIYGGLILGGVLCGSLFAQSTADSPSYKNSQLPVERRVQDLLARMTDEEKVSLLSGSGWMESVAIPRLGIPSIKMADGPMGIRIWTGPSSQTSVEGVQRTFSSTAFPVGINLAASWDPALAEEEGRALGEEVRSIGRDMILGPTVNIQRTPLWGRNFESFGEDPFLAGRIGVGYIRGVQSQGVIATVKHFVVNNQEFERHRIDVGVSERALHELYYPAFEAAIRDGGVYSVMSSYNRVNGTYAAESPLLRQELFEAMKFTGFVVSDWGSTYSTAPTVNAGMSLEMPGGPPMQRWLNAPGPKSAGNDGGYLTADKVLPLMKSGEIPHARVDENVARMLRVMFETGIFDQPHAGGVPIDTAAQRAVARKAADEGIVLLKNQGSILPLVPARIKSLAVIGPAAAVARAGGGGSGLVYAKDVVAPLAAIRKRVPQLDIKYALGVAMPGEEPADSTPEARRKLMDEAVDAAKSSDAALVFVGYSWKLETEGKDRPDMNLPAGQDALIRAVTAANKNTIVVLNSGDPVTLTSWINQTPALLCAWYGGEEGGTALADVLFGDVNPSGKLPFTFIKRLEDSPSYRNYPGVNLHVEYAEGIYVGYRYFDKHPEIAPAFPFGHGLSYTRFSFSHLEVPKSTSADGKLTVSVTVTNTGERKGAEVAQLYVSNPGASVDRPVRELKGFERVELAPGESKVVRFALDRRSFSFYNPAAHAWTAEPGEFTFAVGASSRDLPVKGSFRLTGESSSVRRSQGTSGQEQMDTTAASKLTVR